LGSGTTSLCCTNAKGRSMIMPAHQDAAACSDVPSDYSDEEIFDKLFTAGVSPGFVYGFNPILLPWETLSGSRTCTGTITPLETIGRLQWRLQCNNDQIVARIRSTNCRRKSMRSKADFFMRSVCAVNFQCIARARAVKAEKVERL
jgi:hypothetical protein